MPHVGEAAPLESPDGPDQSELFSRMRTAEDDLNRVLHDLRDLRASVDAEVMQKYGGKDYPRQFSLGITRLEEGVLWLGQVLKEPLR